MNDNIKKQIATVIRVLDGRTQPQTSPMFEKALEWLSYVWGLTEEDDRKSARELMSCVITCFQISESEVLSKITGVEVAKFPAAVRNRDEQLRAILPKGGWFQWYDEYTRYNECPLSYHIFGSLAVLGASLGRNVWKDMGFFKVWPNYCLILIGPTGRVKKTTAVDIARGLIEKAALCPVMADQVTPEKMILRLSGDEKVGGMGGHQFIYGGELSAFLGKQKYNEGMIVKILRILDCPNKHEVDTVSRGPIVLENLAVTFIGATTMSLLMNSMPNEVTSSGFINRFMVVNEESTDRFFPEPSTGPNEKKLLEVLYRVKSFKGEMWFAPGEAQKYHTDWYRQRWEFLRNVQDEVLAETLERSHTHFIRTAMLTHLVQCDNREICLNCLQTADGLLRYTEKAMPQMVQALRKGGIGQEQDVVYTMLVKMGGASDHSSLLRRLIPKGINASSLKSSINTLVESGLVRSKKIGQGMHYIVVEDRNEQR